MNNILLKKGERIDDLELDGLKIIQRVGGYKFSTDSVLLSNFGKARSLDKYVDLCSGSGVVAILFSYKNKLKKAYAVEIQENMADMAKRSIKLNRLDDKIEVVCADIKDGTKLFGHETIDVITVNPPYNKVGEISEEEEIAIATHEVKLKLDELISVSSKLLKFGGKLFIVYRADRITELICELAKNNLEPKVIEFVYPNSKKEANLVLIEAKKGAKSGVKILKPLVICNDDGTMTKEVQKIYGKIK